MDNVNTVFLSAHKWAKVHPFHARIRWCMYTTVTILTLYLNTKNSFLQNILHTSILYPSKKLLTHHFCWRQLQQMKTINSSIQKLLSILRNAFNFLERILQKERQKWVWSTCPFYTPVSCMHTPCCTDRLLTMWLFIQKATWWVFHDPGSGSLALLIPRDSSAFSAKL